MLDRILNFIAAFIAKTTTTTTITPAIGTGSVSVMQFGKVVLVSGLINTTTALAHGERLISGIPKPKADNIGCVLLNNNSVSEGINYGYVGSSNNIGILNNFGAKAAANRSFRISVVYIAA